MEDKKETLTMEGKWARQAQRKCQRSADDALGVIMSILATVFKWGKCSDLGNNHLRLKGNCPDISRVNYTGTWSYYQCLGMGNNTSNT